MSNVLEGTGRSHIAQIGNKILVEKGFLIKIDDGHILNEKFKDEGYGLLFNYNGYHRRNITFKWTIKGAKYIRNIVLDSLEEYDLRKEEKKKRGPNYLSLDELIAYKKSIISFLPFEFEFDEKKKIEFVEANSMEEVSKFLKKYKIKLRII